MDDTNLPDSEVFARWRSGDAGMGKLFFRRHAAKLLGYFRRNVYDRSQAEELVQDTFLECLRGHGSVDNPRAYLFGIASHVFSRYIRRRQRDAGRLDDWDDQQDSIQALDPDPEFFRLQTDEDRLFMKAMRKLPFNQQIVLELSFWEEMSGREIAEALGLPEGTVRSRIRLARKNMQALLAALQESPEQFRTATLSFDSWQRRIHEYMSQLDPNWLLDEGDD